MAGPLSVEDILAKQKAEREAAAKPKFLTKEQRAKLALEKRNAEVKEQQAREEEEKRSRIDFEQQAEEERRKTEAARYGQGNGQYGGGGYGRQDRYGRDGHRQNGNTNGNGNGNGWQNDRNGRGGYSNGGGQANGNGQAAVTTPTAPRGHAPPSAPRSMQNGHTPATASPLAGSSTPVPGSPKPNTPGDAAAPTDAELSIIRARYLGQKADNKKPRLRKIADKKMIFDWNAADDTTAAEQGTWSGQLKGQGPGGAMFGGRIAGFEEEEPVQEGKPQYADALEKRRAGRGNNDERHWSEKPLEEMKDRDWRIFREDYSIAARGGQIPLPLRSWRESNIPEKILSVIEEVGYTEPSPIQRQAIPIGMQNRDLIGVAKTGSGKTAAFVIPMLDYISHLPPLDDENRHKGPYALIMAPTRELAQQIESETVKFAAKLNYTCVSIIGGRSVEEQQFQLRNGAEIIIATPGRLKDMIDKSMLVMSQCRYVVMDEADRMVDLGFEIDLNFILDSMPATLAKPDSAEVLQADGEWKGWRVTTLFSATMPPAVDRLARKYLRKPATVTIGTAGEAVDTVEQRVEFVHGEEKRKARLIEILRTIGLPPPMIVFVNQKKTADMVVKYVHQAGLSGTTLHSDKTQAQREAALQALRDGEVNVLVATDVAGRGIDINNLSLVLNWQMPDTIEKYVHRIGRTGRAGKTGLAITFLTNDDDEVMYDLKQEIAKSAISTMNPELARHEAAKQRITREMKRKRDEEEDR
ncbi:Pre-mRNA-splicing ATP-dependent RNA helicase PRP28 [Naematelia encephala]|uniref:RNA helicase n=1 Tax=Naematelia encephala TaxID=71784 RepID=A0A1Y2B8N7_9TREE|nr:Pre-mRNA-splicing ATP-dependent RNA helicase PRP28 [Naematelia encephala]